jgi:hypothetical protein
VPKARDLSEYTTYSKHCPTSVSVFHLFCTSVLAVEVRLGNACYYTVHKICPGESTQMYRISIMLLALPALHKLGSLKRILFCFDTAAALLGNLNY